MSKENALRYWITLNQGVVSAGHNGQVMGVTIVRCY